MSIIETAIGWLTPPQCVSCGDEGSALCNTCYISEIKPFVSVCWLCSAPSRYSKTCSRCLALGSPDHVWISTSYGGVVKELVRIYKFKHLRAAALPMASIMTETFIRSGIGRLIPTADYLVVPVPTATSRKRERSFGHAELLARQVAIKLRLEKGNVLARLGQDRQVGSQRTTRLNQPKNKYYVRRPARVRGRNILLIDDVITTGGTLIATTQALRAAGATRVDALVFAKRL